MGLFKSSAKKHIEGHKELTKHAPIIRLEEVNPDACKKLYFPTMAPNGKPMTILVKEGDTVCVGTKIAERTDFYVPVYSPVSGKVLGIEDCFSSTIGRTIKHIVIENDFRKEKQLLPTVTLESSKEELFAAMKEAGLVGMGGAGFPTYVKYNNVSGIDTILINAVECEPYLTTDFLAVQEDAKALCEGAKLLMKIADAKEAIIALKVHKEEAKKAILDVISNYENVRLVEVPDQYPMGWERTLIRQVLKREYDRLPAEAHVIVNNAQTVICLAHAMLEGIVPMNRLVTISGDGIVHPGSVLCPLGTLASACIEACGGYSAEEIELIPGGPMCGKTVQKDTFPIQLAIGGLTILKYKKPVPSEPCLRCGGCTSHCPAFLQPVEIKLAVEQNQVDRMIKLDAMSCVECGMCSYVCPSKINVTDFVRKAKLQIRIYNMKNGGKK